MERIIMKHSTFDSNKKKLPAGAEFKVSDDEKAEDAVSTADAKILVDNGVAEEVGDTLDNLTVPQIKKRLTALGVEFPGKAKKADLLAWLKEQKPEGDPVEGDPVEGDPVEGDPVEGTGEGEDAVPGDSDTGEGAE